MFSFVRLNFNQVSFFPLFLKYFKILFKNFPASSEQQLRLSWDENRPILFSDDYNWGVFDMISFKNSSSKTSYDVIGPFSRLEVIFRLRRKLGYFLIDVYLPSALFVISSWASFWIDIPAAPARIALVLTTMLTHVTSTKSIHEKHPRVAYIHSLDVWVMVCSSLFCTSSLIPFDFSNFHLNFSFSITVFIFAALIEYATANYFYHKRDRMKDKKPDISSENLAKHDTMLFTNPIIEIDSNNNEDIENLSISSLNLNISKPLQRHESCPRLRSREFLSPEYSLRNDKYNKRGNSTGNVPNSHQPTLLRRAWKSMLSLVVPPYEHDIETRRTALEIDRKSRFIFPAMFIVFNIVYWTILIVFSFIDTGDNL